MNITVEIIMLAITMTVITITMMMESITISPKFDYHDGDYYCISRFDQTITCNVYKR